jgi:hypothetical protein
MTLLVNSTVYRFAAWGVLVASGLLIAWQVFAFFTGRIPDHILPLVRLLSGSHESVPVAYAWTMRLGLLSVAAFLGAGFLLVWLRVTRKRAAS